MLNAPTFMLKKDISLSVLNNLKHQPSSDQSLVVEGLAELASKNQEGLMIIDGAAGSGKTSVVAAFTQALKLHSLDFMLLASTGRAAKVLASYCKHRSFTIHRIIYRQQRSGMGDFSLNFNKKRNCIFIVDEASMISAATGSGSSGPASLLEDLLNFVFNGDSNKLLFVGDSSQLPPVFQPQSRALDPDDILFQNPSPSFYKLEESLRQQQGSGILLNALRIKACKLSPKSLQLSTTDDFLSVAGEEFLSSLESSYHDVGYDQVILLCGSNKRANLYNQGIRSRILYREEDLTPGDRLIIGKNNYFWVNKEEGSQTPPFLANGEICTVIQTHGTQSLYSKEFTDVTIQLEDSPIELRVNILRKLLNSPTANLSSDELLQFYNEVSLDYPELSASQRHKAVLDNPYYNALQCKFAYAITAHKAQGGQWKHVYIDFELFSLDQINEGYLRWLYTAVTRSSEKVFLVNFPSQLIQQNMDQ